jgi:hypothetical protein
LLKGGDGGLVVSADSPDTSSLLERVTSQDMETRMPPEGEPLHPDQIHAIREWIQNGASIPNGEQEESDPQSHWAFRPPQKQLPSEKGTVDVGNHPVDLWIAEVRSQQGLSAQKEAPKSIWLRRVHLDLVGLPPSIDEIRAFEQDHSADAKAKVVEKLLSSPHYGERWGRHWMDIWRYSDWWGLGEEVRNSQKHMWHWRDWIVESLNEDKGYDQMLLEMLAADEVYPDDLNRLRATGYLARQYFKFNRTSWMDETIEHTAKGMLGLTFNCAKCHDHKYDPITQQDYYRFRAIFEPYQIRTEMLPGQPNLTQNSIPRAFDCNLEAPTYVHVRGDDRNPDRSQVMQPAIPSVLEQTTPFQVASVALPPTSVTPGLRAHVVETVRQTARNKLSETQKQIAELDTKLKSQSPRVEGTEREALERERVIAERRLQHARAELVSIDWRHQADLLAAQSPGSPEAERAAERAAAFDRRVDVESARLKLAQIDASLANAPSDKRKEFEDQKKVAEGELASMLKQVDAPGKTYRSLRGAEKTLESNTESEESRRKPFPSTSSGRRSALARWMIDRNHPLTARVAVNHVWARHFGSPLVPTVFDFGRKGTPPVHQDLLDYLAVELMESGWSLKHLHRIMVLSHTYAMSSSNSDMDNEKMTDPDNRFYWRMNPIRMESQSVRDSLLFLAGELDLRLGGPSIPSSDALSRRRSLYYFQSHNEHEKFLSIFDDANVLDCYRRAQSIVPQQALALQNSPLIQLTSQRIAERIAASIPEMDDAAFVRTSFEWLLASSATEEEVTLGEEAMKRWRDHATDRGVDPTQHARIGLIRSLINHNDFVTVR